MTKTVVALFDSAARAERAAQALKQQGFADARLQRGVDFLAHGRVPPLESESGGLRRGIERFLEELGVKAPHDTPGYHALAADDMLIVLETADDRAPAAAAVLDDSGALDVEQRRVSTERDQRALHRSRPFDGARIYGPPTQRPSR